MLRTFRIGGIHPPENKLSAGKKITALAAPKQVIIPLSQHIGAPAQAVVKKGDLVKVGTLVAKAGGFVSANIHSSVSGKVNKIDNALDSSGYKRTPTMGTNAAPAPRHWKIMYVVIQRDRRQDCSSRYRRSGGSHLPDTGETDAASRKQGRNHHHQCRRM